MDATTRPAASATQDAEPRGAPAAAAGLLSRFWLVLAALLVSGCATIPPPRAAWNLVAPGPPSEGARVAYNGSVFENVWQWVDDHYHDPAFNGVDWAAMRGKHRPTALAARSEAELYTAINDMLDELGDRHTQAVPAEEFARFFRHLNVVVGIRSRPVPGQPEGPRRVVEVFDGSPAHRAGVRAGWILLSCDGRPPAEVLGPGKLKEGQVVQCEFLKPDGAKELVALEGKRMSVPTFRRTWQPAPGYVVIQFESFDMPTAEWLESVLRKHHDAQGVILDLRGNGGGHLFALAAMLGSVFENPVSLGRMVHRGRTVRWHRAIAQKGANYQGPLAILISKHTASAAEIFAQVVKEQQRALVVGEKSAGATLTSVFWPLRAGGRLQISVYDYRSPKGHRLEGNGVSPDIPLAEVGDPYAEENDPAIDAALRALQTRQTPQLPSL